MSEHATVLLVEDQNGFLFESIFKAINGFTFLSATRGDAAVIEFAENKIDLVLMDIRMPGDMDGLAAVRQIRKMDVRVPIIVITAYSDEDTRQQAFAAGANDFYTKPFNYHRVYNRMRQLLAEAARVPATNHMQRLISAKSKRLQALEEKRAAYGMEVPVSIITEIEELKRELEDDLLIG